MRNTVKSTFLEMLRITVKNMARITINGSFKGMARITVKDTLNGIVRNTFTGIVRNIIKCEVKAIVPRNYDGCVCVPYGLRRQSALFVECYISGPFSLFMHNCLHCTFRVNLPTTTTNKYVGLFTDLTLPVASESTENK